MQEGFFVDPANAQEVQHMIVPPSGDAHAPLPFDLLQAVNMASHPGSPGTISNSGTPQQQKIAQAKQTLFAPPPPLTFGARSQRFNPYATSSAKGYYYASPAPAKPPRARRQSF